MNKPQLIIFGFIGAVALLAVLLLTGALPGLKERPPAPFTLTIWGFRDEPEIWQALTQKYQGEKVKSATINYIKKDPQTYEAELLNELAAGRGPDIFLVKDSWLEKYKDKIRPLPDASLGYQKKNLRNIFVDGAAGAITDENGALLGTPLALDTLALFFNRDYFNSANIPAPPRTWNELIEHSQRLTKLSSVGGIQRSGLALGTAGNVEHAPDILTALIYQSGGLIINTDKKQSAIDSPAAEVALLFYTSFSNSTKKTYSWNAFFENSISAFAKGDTAMALGYAADVPKIAALNPQLNFDVAPLPQAAGAKTQINYGRFQLMTVSRTSQEAEPAWNFLLWLQNKTVQKTYIDSVGLPPARRDLASSKPPREYLTPFYDQALSARIPPLVLGDSLGKIINDMIEAVTSRRFNIPDAVSRAESEINILLKNQQQ